MSGSSWMDEIIEVRSSLGELRAELQEIFDADILRVDPELQSALKASLGELTRSCDSLRHPTLDVATVGTTSAGKSTFINAMLGLELAPMDVNEMSAGLLQIDHGDRWSLSTDPPLTGSEKQISPEGINRFLHRHMSAIIEGRKNGDDVQEKSVNFSIHGPLFPMNEQHDFYHMFQGGISLRVFDLPGLRTVNDRANMAVIRQKIKRSFTLVVLDLNSLFAVEQRDALLDELKETVRNLGNNTSTILFIANQADKIDHTSLKNKSLERRCEEAADAIRQSLGLEQDAELHLVPFSSLINFRSTQMFLAATESTSSEEQKLRKPFLDDVKSRYVRRILDDDYSKKFKNLYRQLEDDLEDGDESEPEDLRTLACLGMRAAGHSDFWEKLGDRVHSEGIRLIAYPACNQALIAVESLLNRAFAIARLQQTNSIEDLERFEAALRNAQSIMTDGFSRGVEMLHEDLDSIRELQEKTSDKGKTSSEMGDKLESLGIQKDNYEYLHGMREMVGRLVREIEERLLMPLEPFLAEKLSVFELEQAMKPVVSDPRLLKNLQEAYEKLKDTSYFEYSDTGATVKYDTGSKDPKVEKIRAVRVALAEFTYVVRQIITKHAEFYLRTEGDLVAVDIAIWLSNRATGIWQNVRTQVSSEIESSVLDQISIPDTLSCEYSQEDVLSIPDEAIEIPDPVAKGSSTRKAKVGTTHEDPDASCFKGAERDVFEDVAMTIYAIPSRYDLLDMIVGGVKQGQMDFWERFFEWFHEVVEVLKEDMENEIDTFMGTVNRAILRRKSEIRENSEMLVSHWREQEEHFKNILLETKSIQHKVGFKKE